MHDLATMQRIFPQTGRLPSDRLSLRLEMGNKSECMHGSGEEREVYGRESYA